MNAIIKGHNMVTLNLISLYSLNEFKRVINDSGEKKEGTYIVCVYSILGGGIDNYITFPIYNKYTINKSKGIEY